MADANFMNKKAQSTKTWTSSVSWCFNLSYSTQCITLPIHHEVPSMPPLSPFSLLQGLQVKHVLARFTGCMISDLTHRLSPANLYSACQEASFDNELQTSSKGQTRDTRSDLVHRYLGRLMECQNASVGELPLHPITGSQSEFMKRQPVVLEQMSNILAGFDHARKFRETIDLDDAKCRQDMVDVIARQFKFMGMLMRVMYCVEDLSKAPMDPAVCCQRFVEEVKLLVNAKTVRLWLVDEKKSLIWEWIPGQGKPVQRHFVVSGGTSPLLVITSVPAPLWIGWEK